MIGLATALHYFADDAAPAHRLADALSVPAHLIHIHRFPDGESLPTVAPAGDVALLYRSLDQPEPKLFPTALAADALRRHGASEVVMVAPYLPYMRQDALFELGQSLSQSVFARFITAHFDRLITVDAHLHRTKNLAELFAPMPASNLRSTSALAAWLRESRRVPDLIIGPDEESEPWVRSLAEALQLSWLTLRKVRRGDATVEVTADRPIPGHGQRVLIVDDICSTGSTLVQSVELVRQAGPAELNVYVTHALFGATVSQTLKDAGAGLIFSSDSVDHDTNAVMLASTLADELQRPGY